MPYRTLPNTFLNIISSIENLFPIEDKSILSTASLIMLFSLPSPSLPPSLSNHYILKWDEPRPAGILTPLLELSTKELGIMD
jgi:hypothetical protein